MSPSRSQEKFQMVGLTSNPGTVPKSLPVPFQIGFLSSSHQFLLVPSVPIHLLGRYFLETDQVHIFSSPKGEILLDLTTSNNKTEVIFKVLSIP